jgi:hypothetical protein
MMHGTINVKTVSVIYGPEFSLACLQQLGNRSSSEHVNRGYSNLHCLFKNNSNTLFSACVVSASGRFALVSRPELCQGVLIFVTRNAGHSIFFYPLFGHPNRIRRSLQTKKLLLKQISPLCRLFHPIRSKYVLSMLA